MDEDKPLLIDLYFGGARSKGFALFRNTQVAFGFPEVASELVRDIFEFFDLFLFLFIILARNIDCKSILQKTSKQFGLVLQNTSENRHTSAIFSASHFAGEFAYVARYVSPKCVSVWLFTVETLTFPPIYTLEFVLHHGKPTFITLPVKFPPIDQSFSCVLQPEV